MYAYELKAKLDANLVMSECDGELEWIGDYKKWAKAQQLENEYERNI